MRNIIQDWSLLRNLWRISIKIIGKNKEKEGIEVIEAIKIEEETKGEDPEGKINMEIMGLVGIRKLVKELRINDLCFVMYTFYKY